MPVISTRGEGAEGRHLHGCDGGYAPLEEEAQAHSVPPPFLQSRTYFTKAGTSGLKEM